MPGKWAAHALEANDDPELMSTRANVATVEGMICAVQEELRDGKDGTEIIEDLKSVFEKVRDAYSKKDAPTLVATLDKMAEVLASANAYDRKVAHLLDLMERQRRLQETEIRRMAALHLYVSSQHLAAFMARLRLDVLEVVTSTSERAELARRIAGYFSSEAGNGTLREFR